MRALPLAFLLLVSACAANPRVRTDFDPSANFAAYRTYSWVPYEVPRGMNPFDFQRVRASIDRSLAARGYTQASPGDFLVSFTIGEKDRTEVNDYGGYYSGSWWDPGWGWGWGWGYPYGWGPVLSTYTVTDRSIVIDISDARTRKPVWHGVVTRTGWPDRVDYSKLDQSVDAVVAEFPPRGPPKAY